MRQYREGGYLLEVNGDKVDLYAGTTCVKSTHARKNELEIDAIKRAINGYIKGECYREYIKLCNMIERKLYKKPVEVTEDLWLEYLKTLPVIRLRAILKDAECDYGQTT